MADANAIIAGKAYVLIEQDDSRLASGLAKTETSLTSWATKVGATVGAYLSIRASYGFAKSAVQAAATLEESQLALQGAVGGDTTALEAFASKLALTTKLTRLQAMEVMTMGARFGYSGEQLEKMTKLAIGFSSYGFKGLNTPEIALRQIALAMSRGPGAAQAMMLLSKIPGVNFNNAQGPGGTLNALEGPGMKGFARVEAEMSGMAGQFHRLDEATVQLKEQFGRGIVEGGHLGEIFADLTQEVGGAASAVEEFGQVIGRGLAFLGAVLFAVIATLEGLAAKMLALVDIISGKSTTGQGVGGAISTNPILGPIIGVLKYAVGGTQAGAKAASTSLNKSGTDNYIEAQKLWDIATGKIKHAARQKGGKLPGLSPGEDMEGGAGEGFVAGTSLAGADPSHIATGGAGGGPMSQLVAGQTQGNTALQTIAQNTTALANAAAMPSGMPGSPAPAGQPAGAGVEDRMLEKLIEIAQFTYRIELNTSKPLPAPYKVP